MIDPDTSTTGPATASGTPTTAPRALRWAGTRAFLLECASLADVVALHAHLTAAPLPGQVEAVAAAETVTLSFTHRAAAVAGARAVQSLTVTDRAGQSGRTVDIDVVYDGEDLAEVGRLTGLGADGVVRVHTQTLWTGAFGGFAPGFTYLVAEDDPLQVPRRSTPRTSVPAGSVAIAGHFSAVYPRSSPGGWQLLGHTDARMWDLERSSPALVRPGDRVRYRAVRELLRVTRDPEPAPESMPEPTTAPEAGTAGAVAAGGTATSPSGPPVQSAAAALVVEAPGLQSLVQDLGRPGLGDLGVSASGAADTASARQANRLVGNPPGEAVIEALLGGLSVRARGSVVLALAGADTPARITSVPGSGADDRPAPPRTPFALHDGETLILDEPTAGLRTYLAVRGGLDVPAVLDSRSTDTMSGIGPEPLASGTELPVRGDRGFAAVGTAEPALRRLPRAGEVTTLRVVPGPRQDWFGAAGLEVLGGQDWAVSSQSNRIGVRLEAPAGGTPLERVREGELSSEGAVAGALQVPPSGLPVLFLADHPVTGGYPVIGVVVPEDLPLAAQLPPGAGVRFEPVTPLTLVPAVHLDAATAPERGTADPGADSAEHPATPLERTDP
ncbi:5-oxoprolinase/urea amidolyase family protein [Citricoccus sp.]|uniref:5-oxoprolinase subunit B/C family protein n=1 Tax=Citricoccus sp. TaxID=1978372 RepID=UPI002C833094|nr:5-oxoprolinase/urea amidolyase family protein [Citricoccus sp.]HRO93205.1 5-oxoprolinase/urea amidolyase family protein [Citricoccus sp.]